MGMAYAKPAEQFRLPKKVMQAITETVANAVG